jgi:GH24 family phage-related lysozyme (muramidase)
MIDDMILLLNKATPLIQQFEGFVASPYYCSALKLTIGYGQVIKPNGIYGGRFGSEIIKLSAPIPEVHQIKARNLLLKNQWGNLITKEQATELLHNHIKNDWLKIKNHLPPIMGIHQKVAVVSFLYNENVGLTKFEDSTLFKKLKKSDFIGAAEEFEKWIFVNGQKNKGLINRRKIEKNIFTKALELT